MNPLICLLLVILFVGISFIALVMYTVVKFSEPTGHDETFKEYYDN
jgi:hypothetical protein